MFSFSTTFQNVLNIFLEKFNIFLQAPCYPMLLCVIALGVLAYFYYMKSYFDYWKVRGIKYVKAVPIFGSFLPVALMRKSEGELINDAYRKYKGEKVVGFFKFKCEPGLIIRDPGIIHQILVKDFHHFANNDFETEDPILKHNLTLQKDEM